MLAARSIGDSLLSKANVLHLDSMNGNDMFRFRNLQQWFTRSSWVTKTDFLRKILDVCGDPLFLYILKKIFGRAYSADIVYNNEENTLSFDILPDDDNRSLNVNTLKQMMIKDTNWFEELSKKSQVMVFVNLMILGGINVIITTCKYIDDSITSNGNLSSLKDLITENLEIQNENNMIIYNNDILTKDLTKFQKILTKSNLAKNKVKITDLVYHNYVERTNEWENKLDSFDQKYCMNHENSTEVDSDLDQMLPISTVIPFDEKLLRDHERSNNINTSPIKEDPLLVFNETVTHRSTEHIPMHLSRTLASVEKYKNARNHIDLEIEKHLKLFQGMKKLDKMELDKMEMHLARPSNDRRTKQSENACVLKGVRPGMSVERYNMINGFDTKIITMLPQKFCEDAHNYKTFPRYTFQENRKSAFIIINNNNNK